ncbi:MAG: ExbD/TolR family protein [Kiloniellales bacterium]
MLVSGLSQVTAAHSHQRRRALIGLTPLIDVIFVVLIFFMLAGRLAAPDAFAVTPPDSTSDRQPEPRQIVLLLAADGRVALDNEIVEDAALGALVATHLEENGSSPVQLKADSQSDAHRVVAVMRLLQSAGVQRLTLLTNPQGS